MKRYLLLTTILLSACAPTLDPSGGAAYYTGLAEATQSARIYAATAAPVTQSHEQAVFNQSLTLTSLPPALTQLANDNDATALANQSGASSLAVTQAAREVFIGSIPTMVAATGTALAIHSQKDIAELESARAVNNIIGWSALGLIAAMCIGCYWLLGLARADVKRKNALADNNKPQVFGNLVIYPNGKGGYVHQSIIVGRVALPGIEAPELDTVPRFIKRNGVGVSNPVQVLDVVSDMERDWRECCVDALLEFERAGTFASTGLCGDGKPFASTTHWMRVTNALKDNSLILKENGGPTLLALPTYADAIAYVQTARDFHFPDRRPPKVRKSL